jgi:hypothetical protein
MRLTCYEVPGGIGQRAKSLDPECAEPEPEVVVEGGRVLQPEDVEVPVVFFR